MKNITMFFGIAAVLLLSTAAKADHTMADVIKAEPSFGLAINALEARFGFSCDTVNSQQIAPPGSTGNGPFDAWTQRMTCYKANAVGKTVVGGYIDYTYAWVETAGYWGPGKPLTAVVYEATEEEEHHHHHHCHWFHY